VTPTLGHRLTGCEQALVEACEDWKTIRVNQERGRRDEIEGLEIANPCVLASVDRLASLGLICCLSDWSKIDQSSHISEDAIPMHLSIRDARFWQRFQRPTTSAEANILVVLLESNRPMISDLADAGVPNIGRVIGFTTHTTDEVSM